MEIFCFFWHSKVDKTDLSEMPLIYVKYECKLCNLDFQLNDRIVMTQHITLNSQLPVLFFYFTT
jgi:hypothetical protein